MVSSQRIGVVTVQLLRRSRDGIEGESGRKIALGQTPEPRTTLRQLLGDLANATCNFLRVKQIPWSDNSMIASNCDCMPTYDAHRRSAARPSAAKNSEPFSY